jgi:hypothetical protein
MQTILDYLRAMLDWIVSLVTRSFEALWTMATDFACWVLDGLLGAGVSLLTALNNQVPSYNLNTAWSGLPVEVAGMAAALGVGEALAIIVAALVIRFILQMIPFVRWGS